MAICRRFIAGILVTLVFAPLLARTIEGVGIFSTPRDWSAPCPADLKFVGTINASRWPVRVEYRWERSDGAVSARRFIEVRSQHQRVTETWRLGRYRQHMVVWERLHVLAPTNIKSGQALVTVNCR